MSPFWTHPSWSAVVWPLTGILAACLFFGAVALLALAVRYRRGAAVVGSAALLALSYMLLQCAGIHIADEALPPTGRAVAAFFGAGNGLLGLMLCLCIALGEWILVRACLRYVRHTITPSSIKEAMDSLPSGICFYRDDGRVILVNRAMEVLCRRLTGEALVSGAAFYEALSRNSRATVGEAKPAPSPQDDAGAATDGGKLAAQMDDAGAALGDAPLIVLPDGTAWSFSRKQLQDDRLRANMLIASDVTQIYEKTLALRDAREKVAALNRRLTDYNREIVSLTAAREILNAKVKIHDELGGNLLAIRRYMLEGGAARDRSDILEKLRLNIAFLKSGRTRAIRDEYALMLETAEALGVHVTVEGEPPAFEPARHILAVGIHECFTNTLRHAHGSALRVRITGEDGCIRARFTNDGEQPHGPIRERGGLRSLRAMAEDAGGRMEVFTEPAFCVEVTLPKEDDDGLSSDDRG